MKIQEEIKKQEKVDEITKMKLIQTKSKQEEQKMVAPLKTDEVTNQIQKQIQSLSAK